MCIFWITCVSAQDLDVMSYNMRLDLTSDAENAWQNRRAAFIQQVRDINPDIVGTQEGLPHQIEDLDRAWKSYDYIGIGRDGGKGLGEYCAIYYKSEKLELITSNTFWLSPTPEKKSKGWDAAYIRICTYGLFKDKKTGNHFWVFNTHLDNKGSKARKKSVKLIRKTISKINIHHYPVILTGDFNAEAKDKPIRILKRAFRDVKDLSLDKNQNLRPTFNGFECLENTSLPIIDYIFISKSRSSSVEVKSYKVFLDGFENCIYPSDHFAILAQIEFVK